jgi:predicted  nucleic acid-binding Zn-ribbon protein
LGDVIRHEGKLIDEQIKSHINMNQEKLIEELNAKVFFKDSELMRLETSYRQALKDLDVYKRKYSKLKHQKLSNVEETMKDLKMQMARLEKENRDLGHKLKSASS